MLFLMCSFFLMSCLQMINNYTVPMGMKRTRVRFHPHGEPCIKPLFLHSTVFFPWWFRGCLDMFFSLLAHCLIASTVRSGAGNSQTPRSGRGLPAPVLVYIVITYIHTKKNISSISKKYKTCVHWSSFMTLVIEFLCLMDLTFFELNLIEFERKNFLKSWFNL